MIRSKSPREIRYMCDAGKVVAQTHEELAKAAKQGISTKELDQIAEDYIISQGAVPSFKGYRGFPASICTSVNHVVVHGIPSLDQLGKFLKPQKNCCRSQKKVCTKGLSRPLLETGSPIYPVLCRLMWKTMVFLWYEITVVMELVVPCMRNRKFLIMGIRDMDQSLKLVIV